MPPSLLADLVEEGLITIDELPAGPEGIHLTEKGRRAAEELIRNSPGARRYLLALADEEVAR